jgi:hypothetical protein
MPVLLLLPLIFGVTWALFVTEGNILYELSTFADNWIFPASLASWILAGLLLTPVLQRRAKPEAAWARFANPLRVPGVKPRSVLFAIDHAPEDGQYAKDLPGPGTLGTGCRLMNPKQYSC